MNCLTDSITTLAQSFAAVPIARLFETETAERFGWALVHSLWQIALLAAVYLIFRQLMRRQSAAARYVVACLIMLAMAVVPVVTALVVQVQSSVPLATRIAEVATAAENQFASQPVQGVTPSLHETDPSGVTVADADAGQDLSVMSSLPARTWRDRLRTSLQPTLPWLVAFWFTGAVLLALRQLGG